MASATTVGRQEEFGQTARKDAWWLGPGLTAFGLLAFVVYSTWAGLQGTYFEIRQDRATFGGPEVAPYLSPFYSPLIYDARSPHAWIHRSQPSWWPDWMPFSAALLILAGPGLFRLTCYYYRKAYYRSIWMDPPGCVVGEPRRSYWGENHWPLLLQNAHRYTLYVALLFLVFLWWDVVLAFWWPTSRSGALLPDGSHQLGLGLGTLIMLVNVILLSGFTLGCNSLRHLSGGRLNSFACFSCQAGSQAQQKLRLGYHTWRCSSFFNANHMLWAWLSLFSVGFTDLYIRLCAMGIWQDLRIL